MTDAVLRAWHWGTLHMNNRRIQRQRTKGWRMPPNTVYVGRPSRWGNPFLPMIDESAARRADLFWQATVLWQTEPWWGDWIEPLRGKDLACWCRLDQPCHADVLLELIRGTPRLVA